MVLKLLIKAGMVARRLKLLILKLLIKRQEW